jgi:hypothetical protein
MAFLCMVNTFVSLLAIIPLDARKSLPMFSPSVKKTVVENLVQVLMEEKGG